MSIRFVIILENCAGRSEHEINRALAVHGIPNEWRCFTYEGRPYASWLGAPRYFAREEDPERWEALRKYLVRAREFLGGGAVHLANDVLQPAMPEEAMERWPFGLPLIVWDDELAESDVQSHPELAHIRELEGLYW